MAAAVNGPAVLTAGAQSRVSSLARSLRVTGRGARTLPVYGVCVHTSGTSDLKGAMSFYLRGAIGPHYVIDYDGTTNAIGDEDHIAWHAGWGKPGRRRWASYIAPAWWSSVWRRWNARLPADLLTPAANDPNEVYIGIELRAPQRGWGFTDGQYDALARLVVDVFRRHGIPLSQPPNPRLLGHEDLDPLARSDASGGTDPGAHRSAPRFSWSALWSKMQSLGGGRPAAPSLPGRRPDASAAAAFADSLRRLFGAGSNSVASLIGATEAAAALAAGNRDANRLTDIVFHARHRERGGRRIGAAETQAAREWRSIRDNVIAPVMRRIAGTESGTPVAREGMVSEIATDAPTNVRWVQAALNLLLGRGLVVDGVAGSQTRAAIVDFQRAQGLVADEVVGTRTAAALREALLAKGAAGAPCAGVQRTAEELTGFAFDDHRLQPEHFVQIGKLAHCAAASRPASLRIVGHTDPVGDDAYNLTLGLHRAEEITQALRQALDRFRPGSSGRIHFDVDTRGEAEQIPGSPEQNRRVQVFIPLAAAPRLRRPALPPFIPAQFPPAAKPPIALMPRGWAPPIRSDEAGAFATDRFARQTFDCGAFSVFVPTAALLSTTNRVHVFFSPGGVTGARGGNAVLVHGLRGAAASTQWIVLSVPGVPGGATPITEAQILDCLRRVGLAGRIDRLRLSAHSRGNAGMALTLQRRMLTTAVEHVAILDSTDFARSLIAGLGASRISASKVTSYDVNTGRFPLRGVDNRHLDPLCMRSVGYARLIADALATNRLTALPPKIDALVKALPLPPRGSLTTIVAGKTPIPAFCSNRSRAKALRDLRTDERVGKNIATYGARSNTSAYAFIEFNNVMAFNDPSVPKSLWDRFTPGIYSHHLFVAEIAHELFP